MTAQGPDLAAAKRLLDAAKRGGFHFQRVAPGPDGPLWGVRETPEWRDTIYLAGFSQACTATRARKTSLIIPGGPLVTQRLDGDTLSVLRTVVCELEPLTPAGCRLRERAPDARLPAASRSQHPTASEANHAR